MFRVPLPQGSLRRGHGGIVPGSFPWPGWTERYKGIKRKGKAPYLAPRGHSPSHQVLCVFPFLSLLVLEEGRDLFLCLVTSCLVCRSALDGSPVLTSTTPFILKTLSALHQMKTGRVYNITDLGPARAINLKTIPHGHAWSSLKYRRNGCSDLRFRVSPPSSSGGAWGSHSLNFSHGQNHRGASPLFSVF